MHNLDVKAYAKAKKVKLWEIADVLNITDSQFSRSMRKEFTPEQKEEIKQIIDKIALTKKRG